MSEPIQPRLLPAKSKKEKKGRVAVVKKIIVAVYKRNRSSVRSLLPTTARDDIQQSNLASFLERPENEGLVDRIYGMTIAQGRFRSTDEVAAELNPITIPTIFEPRESRAEREERLRGQRMVTEQQQQELERLRIQRKIEEDRIKREEEETRRREEEPRRREEVLKREEEARREAEQIQQMD